MWNIKILSHYPSFWPLSAIHTHTHACMEEGIFNTSFPWDRENSFELNSESLCKKPYIILRPDWHQPCSANTRLTLNPHFSSEWQVSLSLYRHPTYNTFWSQLAFPICKMPRNTCTPGLNPTDGSSWHHRSSFCTVHVPQPLPSKSHRSHT